MANTAESGFSPVRQFDPYTRPRLARWPIPGRLSQCLLLPVHVWLTAKLARTCQTLSGCCHGCFNLSQWPHSRAPFSVSPITSARLVNCQAGSGCAGVNAKEALCFSGGFPTADQQRNLAVARKVLVVTRLARRRGGRGDSTAGTCGSPGGGL